MPDEQVLNPVDMSGMWEWPESQRILTYSYGSGVLLIGGWAVAACKRRGVDARASEGAFCHLCGVPSFCVSLLEEDPKPCATCCYCGVGAADLSQRSQGRRLGGSD
jgi:hypothetical protein